MKTLLLLLSFPYAALAAQEPFSLSRRIEVRTCDRQGKCSEYEAKDADHAGVDITMEKAFGKGINGGDDGWDHVRVTEKGVPFKAEIHVIRYRPPQKPGYYLYVMLRSGPGTKRHGKVKTLRLPASGKFEEFLVTDQPISFSGGTLQARLVVAPK